MPVLGPIIRSLVSVDTQFNTEQKRRRRFLLLCPLSSSANSSDEISLDALNLAISLRPVVRERWHSNGNHGNWLRLS